jgi:hypothetical protein
VASQREVGIKEKKDNLSGCPSSFKVVAGVRYAAEKKFTGRTIQFAYLANGVEVAQRKAILLAA